MINWGIIGAGRIAHRFCEALSYDPRAKLIAVSCRSQAKADAFKEVHPCNRAYDNFQAVIDDQEIDAVYIALPHLYHYEWVKKALLANKKVLVEKPATMNVEQMEEIKQLVIERQGLFMEAMKTRFVPGYIKAKELINDGIIGDLNKIETTFCGQVDYDPNSYLFEPVQGGGLLDLGIYNIAYLDDYFNHEINDIEVTSNHHDCGADSYVKATMKFGNQVGVVECGIDRNSENQVVMSGSLGKMIIKPIHRPQDIEIVLNDGQTTKHHLEYVHDDFYSEIEHFNDLIETNQTESKIMSLDNSVNCAKILATIREMV